MKTREDKREALCACFHQLKCSDLETYSGQVLTATSKNKKEKQLCAEVRLHTQREIGTTYKNSHMIIL